VALGNAQKTITLGELSQYPFVYPKKAEQEEIVRRMRAAQERLNGELESLNKLRLQKFGLMDDLLTGRVRVTPLLAEAVQQRRSV
jgi:type I restriction enzyme S subunit